VDWLHSASSIYAGHAAHDVQVKVLDLVNEGGGSGSGVVSSSAVREALGAGDMAAVAGLLGRPHRLVLRGQGEAEGQGQELRCAQAAGRDGQPHLPAGLRVRS
jgi:FAD synthase